MSANSISRRALLGSLLATLPLAALAQTSPVDLLRKLPNRPEMARGTSHNAASLSQAEIGLGLKDALKVASQRVVGRVGKTDGYFGDPAIRIPLPGALEKIRGPLKSMGAGGLLDDLQLRMNRAAEEAAPKALNIFVDAASRMTIEDARNILTGPQDGATQYFKRTTSESLTTAFRPVVDQSLSGVGASGVFKSVQAKAGGVPLLGQGVQNFDLTNFTVGRALDGLFHYLGAEEAAIRTNPTARTTDLLKKVFG